MIRILPLFIILFFFSCSKEDGQGRQSDENPEPNSEKINLAQIEVPLLDAEVYQSLITENRGKIIFINAWATWCVPCKDEFPDLVRLHNYYKNSDVVFIGISVDFEDQIESKVKPFLLSQNAGFQNYVQNFKDPADLINLINEDWRGAVPATFIYDKQGNQQVYLLGKHSYEEFKTKIELVRSLN
jgi:thiol-disulfide isomerase/thioredoxin